VFLALETSPGNYQASLALPGAEDKDFARRLRKGTGGDTTASGATRVAGSLNFKDKYAPSFPRVEIHAAYAGRRASADQLERLGLVAKPEAVAQPLRISPARLSPGSNRRWPSYARCEDGALSPQCGELRLATLAFVAPSVAGRDLAAFLPGPQTTRRHPAQISGDPCGQRNLAEIDEDEAPVFDILAAKDRGRRARDDDKDRLDPPRTQDTEVGSEGDSKDQAGADRKKFVHRQSLLGNIKPSSSLHAAARSRRMRWHGGLPACRPPRRRSVRRRV
jgi:RepB DNA-primase from phage plasmid